MWVAGNQAEEAGNESRVEQNERGLQADLVVKEPHAVDARPAVDAHPDVDAHPAVDALLVVTVVGAELAALVANEDEDHQVVHDVVTFVHVPLVVQLQFHLDFQPVELIGGVGASEHFGVDPVTLG